MQVQVFTVGSFQVNTYLLTDPATGQSAIVDTGETDELPQRLKALTPQPDLRMILLTHAHLDHAGALAGLQDAYDLPTWMPRLERPLFETLPYQAQMFGLPMPPARCGRIDHEIDDGGTVQLGQTTLHFLSTPGYVYSYAFGELLVLALYNLYLQDPGTFVPKYLALLKAGGTASPTDLVRPFGLDLNDPGFWAGGLTVIDEMLRQIEG